MKQIKIVKLTQFTLNALETVANELPQFIRDHLLDMGDLMKQYQEVLTRQWDNDGERFQYSEAQERIVKEYYHLIRACFATASGKGEPIRRLYFKGDIPSKIIKDIHAMRLWVKRVLLLMEQPEHNHLNLFKGALLQMRRALDIVDSNRSDTRTTQRNIAGSKREISEQLWDCYQTLKCYLKGWYRGKGKDYRRFFDDVHATPAAKADPQPADQRERPMCLSAGPAM